MGCSGTLVRHPTVRVELVETVLIRFALSLSKGCPSVRIELVEMLVVLEVAFDLMFRGRGLPDGKSLYLLRQIK